MKFFTIIVVFLVSCNSRIASRHNNLKNTNDMVVEKDSSELEIDEIFSLLSYSLVYKFWQSDDRNGRGYNVGCILVDDSNNVLGYGINQVNIFENCTQHGEVRLMTSYLDKKGIYSLKNHVIYSTLEPCAMCAGMMVMSSIRKTVNGQRDYNFTAALERLAFNSESIGGYPSYPRVVVSQDTPSRFLEVLDKAYTDYIERGNSAIITKFLSTEVAFGIYKMAYKEFMNYKPKFYKNNIVYERAKLFYNNLPEKPN